MSPTFVLMLVLSWVAAASVITAGMFALDKRAASRGGPRRSEFSLLVWSLAGGWPGGWIASQWLRHKTHKRSFRFKFVLAAIVNGLLVVGIVAWKTGYWVF